MFPRCASLMAIRTMPGEGGSAVSAARPPVARGLVFPAELDGVDGTTMASLLVFVTTGRLSPLYLILLLCWVRNDAVALLNFVTCKDMSCTELHAFVNGVGMLTAFSRSGMCHYAETGPNVPENAWGGEMVPLLKVVADRIRRRPHHA